MAANLLVKVDYQGDLRRFQATLPLTLSQLTETLKGVFSLPEAVSLRLAYTDSDGDKITVTSDEDLHEAIAYLPATATPSCLRLTLQDILTPSAAPASSSSLLPSAQAPAAAPTSFAFCDVCSKQIPVTQTRFKCGDCANFDLCASCEQNDAHDASHVLLKLKPAAQLRCGRLPTDKAVLPKWSSHHPAASHTQPAPSAEADFTSMLDSALREVRAAAHQPSPSPSPSPSPAAPQVDPMQSLVTSAAQLASTLFAQPPASGAAPQPAAGPQPGAGAGLAPLVSLASSLLASPAAQGAGRNLDLGSLLGSFLQAQPGSGAAPSPAGGAGAGPNFSALLSGLAAAAAAQPSPVDSQTLQPAADPAAEINDDNPASIRNILLDRGVPEQAVDDLIVASGGSLEEALEIWALQELAD